MRKTDISIESLIIKAGCFELLGVFQGGGGEKAATLSDALGH